MEVQRKVKRQSAKGKMERGRSLAVTRFINRLMIFAQRLAPRRLVAEQAGDMFRPKTLHAGSGPV